ncbi:MAG: hypothetical protein JRJ85_13905 [Deltaproteobacteria bacterium]|nr:hypothetical protein [Deltaproteobacteria bacterium]
MKDTKKADLRVKVLLILVYLITVLIITSCASTSTLSSRASRVRLVSALQAHEVEDQCHFLGNVTGTSSLGSCCLFRFELYESQWNYNDDALNQLLDHAAELGATHVFVNLGNGMELRGEAYLCARCEDADGNPDMDYCEMPDGLRVGSYCQTEDGNRIGAAHCEGCEGAETMNEAECREKCGKWFPAISQRECEDQGHRWIPESKDRATCEARGGHWRPKAKDKVSCENKGGIWVINEEVLRLAPSPVRGKEKE